MARSRNIKPGFFNNEVLAECEPLARILFAGLWCYADRDGRLEDRPRRIRADILPYDKDADADVLLEQLASRGFIVRYVANGARYIAIPEFGKHQNPHVKESASTIPAPCKPDALNDHVVDSIEHSASTVLAPEIPERAGLIPSSLIPDSSGKEGASAPDPKKAMWDAGRKLLGKEGSTLLGKLAQQHGTVKVMEAIGRTAAEGPADPKSFLLGCLKKAQADDDGMRDIFRGAI